MASVLTVILNWRTAEMTLRSAETALIAMTGIEGALTIVDNDSGDGSFEVMSAAVVARGWDRGPHRVRVLQAGRNGGFGAGNNVGILAGLPPLRAGDPPGRPDYIYLLNSDAFPHADAIRSLLDHLEAFPETGFAGGFMLGEDGVAQQSTFRFPSILGEFEGHIRFGPVSRLLRRHIVPLPLPETTARVDWLVGASLMIRTKVLEEIGLFDESFFLYYEETDLCRRAALAGWSADYVAGSQVLHLGSASTGMGNWQRIPGYWLDSHLHYFAKSHGRGGAVLATIAAALGGVLWRLRLMVQTKDRQDPPRYLRDMLAHHLRHGFHLKAPAEPELKLGGRGT